jgi:hypothetical protein
MLQGSPLADNRQTVYYWKSVPVDGSAELLTLFCRSCVNVSDITDLPLVSVLRDTLTDQDRKTDRLTSVWLLTYTRPGLGQRVLSAVPFFYWRVGDGNGAIGNPKPLMDLTSPQHPVESGIGRALLQYTLLDPLTTPIRATSRAYRTNEVDHERLHLEEALSYLREAPSGSESPGLTDGELNTLMARLELRKRLLGGLVDGRRAERVGEEQGFEQERVRSRNWELLRLCAEKTGLFFEPLPLAGTDGDYGILWFATSGAIEPRGNSLGPVWKLLNIRDPWTDYRLRDWRGVAAERWLDANGSLVPAGETGVREVKLVPLGAYSMNYPKLPLLLIDFRDKLHIRGHELTQRAIDEITAGVIGLSHFANWYYYVGSDLYSFVAARRGTAMDRASRLDCYSQFRVALALDTSLGGDFRAEMQQRIDSLSVNPLEGSPKRELQLAQARYDRLQTEAREGGALSKRLEKSRRSELDAFDRSAGSQARAAVLHVVSLGFYPGHKETGTGNLAEIERNRSVKANLDFLGLLVGAGTQPEVAYDETVISAALIQLAEDLPNVRSQPVKTQAAGLLVELRGLTRDPSLAAYCSSALTAARSIGVPVAALPRALGATSPVRVDPAR